MPRPLAPVEVPSPRLRAVMAEWSLAQARLRCEMELLRPGLLAWYELQWRAAHGDDRRGRDVTRLGRQPGTGLGSRAREVDA